MAKLRQVAAFSPNVYRGIPFDRERLKRYVESTNKAIEAGIPVPLLARHAPLNADDKSTQQYADTEGRGWIKKFFQDENGALGWEADNVPDDFVKAVNEGTVKLTSPEFRENYKSEKEGVYEGPIVRHVAFTPLPGNPHQGAIETVALAELGVFQFSELDADVKATQHAEDDDADPSKKKKEAGEEFTDAPAETSPVAEEGTAPESPPPTETTPTSGDAPKNPDMPPKATDKSKLAAVLAGLAQKNVVLPSDWNPADDLDKAIDILLGCLNSSIKAEQASQAEAEPEEEESPPEEVSMPFSETNDHELLSSHGYKHVGNDSAGYKEYTHKEGHRVVIADGDWLHEHANSKAGKYKTGNGSKSLKTHLGKVHSSQHSEVVSQFTEEELAALSPKARAIIEKSVKDQIEAAKAKQFAEEQAAIAKANLAKNEAIQFIESKNLPPILMKTLKESLSTVQFSEGKPEAVYTATQVAELFDKALPPDMRFHEGELTEAELPKGASKQFFEEGEIATGHVSDARAEELVAANPIMKSMPPIRQMNNLGQVVAQENLKNPNLVMRS